MITDPPYGIQFVSHHCDTPQPYNVPIAGDDGQIWEVWPDVARELHRVAKDDSAAFIFTRWDMWCKLVANMAPWTVTNMVVWDKGNHSGGDLKGNLGYAHELICLAVKGKPQVRGRRVWNIWRSPRVPPMSLSHSCQKPVDLIRIAIRAYSDPNDLVLDPFCGSGSTLVAAKCLGRDYIGVEIDGGYAEHASARVAGIDASQLEMLL